MKLGQQVVSLELAKRLKELGVKQESYFYWKWFISPAEEWLIVAALVGSDNESSPSFSAYTVAELGEMLPEEIDCWKSYGTWKCNIMEGSKLEDKMPMTTQYDDFEADTEADARAKLLIYLLENKLME